MFNIFINSWKIKEVRKRIIYVLLIILVYRIGSAVPLPGVNITAWQYLRTRGTNRGLFATIAGGGYGTIFTMGIGPYITGSIIMQLLTVAIPRLEQLKKEGEEGRRKINQYTRISSIILAILQSIGMVLMLSKAKLFINPNFYTHLLAVIAMVTGTIFIMWLSELLTEKGIGNGSSVIIFANIISGLPSGILNMYSYWINGDISNKIKTILLLVLFIFLIAFAILVQAGERRIQVQYTKKMIGRTVQGGQNSYIPLKVNIAGVMSIIFAISLLQFPATLNNFIGNSNLDKIVNYLDITMPLGALLYMLLIVCFTFFYTSFSINPIEMSENIKKSGGFIPGIRPGKPTSDYIQNTVNKLSWIGSIFYIILAMLPVLLEWILGIKVGFGGTTLLIITGVALEFGKQLESKLLLRHYKGFLN